MRLAHLHMLMHRSDYPPPGTAHLDDEPDIAEEPCPFPLLARIRVTATGIFNLPDVEGDERLTPD